MAIPSVELLSNRSGGAVAAAMQALNALDLNRQKAKYYGPDIESQINNRNALTQGQNIQNQYMPDKLRLANALAELHNQYYGPNMQSTIANRNALTESRKLQNQYLPEKLKRELEAAEFKKNNPLLNYPGIIGQVAGLNYLKQHPELLQGLNGNTGNIKNGSPAENYVSNLSGQQEQTNPLAQIYNSILNKNNKTPSHSAYSKALADAEEIKNKYGENSREFKNAVDYAERTAKGANEYQQKRAQGYEWATAPPNTKTYLVAQAAGMGLTPDAAIKAFSKGETIEDLAKQHGFNPDDLPEPDFSPTNGNITKLKERQAALKELEVLSKFTREKLGPYSETIFGYSPKQVFEAIKGKNDEGQANFLAARALAQEENLVRLTVANARGTIPAIKGITQKAMNDMKVFRPLVNEKVWTKMQKIIDDKLSEAMQASSKAYKLKGKEAITKEQEKNNKKATVRYNLDTGDFEDIE